MKSYEINGRNCGRDKNGVFHCVCGKCKETDSAAKGDDCRNGCDDSRNGGNGKGDKYVPNEITT